MSIQIRSDLPLNTEVQHLFNLILKLNNYEMVQKDLRQNGAQFDSPSGPYNSWSIRFQNSERIKSSDFEPTILELPYQNLLKEPRLISFHTEGDFDTKCILMPLSVENLTLLHRINLFFGGELSIEDFLVMKYKGKMKKKCENSDEKFFIFQNLLFQEKPLTKEEHQFVLDKFSSVIDPHYRQRLLNSADFIDELNIFDKEKILKELDLKDDTKKKLCKI